MPITGTTVDPTMQWRMDAPDGTTIITNHLISPQPALVDDTLGFEFVFMQLDGEAQTAYQDRHDALRAFEDMQGEYALHDPMGGGRTYTETNATSGTILTAIRPPDAMQADGTGRGLWGLVESVENTTNTSQSLWGLSFSIQYLADLGEYADATAVRNSLEREGIGL